MHLRVGLICPARRRRAAHGQLALGAELHRYSSRRKIGPAVVLRLQWSQGTQAAGLHTLGGALTASGGGREIAGPMSIGFVSAECGYLTLDIGRWAERIRALDHRQTQKWWLAVQRPMHTYKSAEATSLPGDFYFELPAPFPAPGRRVQRLPYRTDQAL